MIQYGTIADAIAALVQKYGMDILGSTPRFIALLSDYAPNLAEEQLIIRAFARAGGMARLAGSLKRKDGYAALLSSCCETAVKAFADENSRHAAVESVKKTAAAIDGRYARCADPFSIYAEGMNYFRRFPKEANVPAAILLFEEAWEEGCTEPLQYLAGAYLKGKGVQQDTEKGMKYLRLASESGNLKAGLEWAEYLWKGIHTEKDVSRAVRILKRLDDGNAYYMLGEIFRDNGEYEKAFEFYVKGAESGHVYAQYAAAVACATGQGVKRDMQKALAWLKAAALSGHGDARKKLEELGEKWD